ncbi:cytochrome-c oxidase, cbb3-type subunit III [Roseiarcaceae bacterium H3SJ34-1]|uniref:cytochrome-c oxidase, cbb3-type subunit III n=1 Tax=Terripilifer ovatus TaxID=3032367 RepID=UPI003AB996A1|nr:cytochrome-c oxidase, cbb3-type subunit III [Roseiarcaceae bacterium H3SJ34-1]
MGPERLDPVTGRTTTGHEWNGIEELNTPIPRVVLFFLAAFTLFGIGYWILMPAWPTGTSYTKGLLGIDQRQVVAEQIRQANAERAGWTDKIAKASFAEIAADPAMMRNVRETGRTLFGDNCAVCHGVKGTGGPGFPNLAAKAWLWGGNPEVIAQTISVGINSTDAQTRVSQMPAFGRTGMLDSAKIRSVVAYVRTLSGQKPDATPDKNLVEAGQKVFASECASCHGDNAAGNLDVGAPNLTDTIWIYGGDEQSINNSVFNGRQGHMPHWSGRLSPVDIKILALYVGTLGEKTQ